MRIDVKEELWCSRSSRLKGKRILVIGTGSVALFKTPEIIRELIRVGAEIQVMLSPDASKLVTSEVFEWASGNKVILEITGNVEHVLLAGSHSQKVDLLIIAPLTATTLGKIVHGIADTNVTLTIMTAIGSKIPILVVPGMHQPMFFNPYVIENLKKLIDLPAISYIEPRIEESKAKLAEVSTIVHWSIKILTEHKLEGKSVLVTGGPTKETIDHVRYLTNPSSGKMGFAFALESWYLGAEVKFIVGPNHLDNLSLFNTIQVSSAEIMANEVKKTISDGQVDIGIFSSAVADYTPKKFVSDKISSGKPELILSLKSTPKILNIVRDIKKVKKLKNLYVVGFKAEYNKTPDELKEICLEYIKDGKANLMVANLIGKKDSGFSVDTTQVFVIDNQRVSEIKGTKSHISEEIMNIIIPEI